MCVCVCHLRVLIKFLLVLVQQCDMSPPFPEIRISTIGSSPPLLLLEALRRMVQRGAEVIFPSALLARAYDSSFPK